MAKKKAEDKSGNDKNGTTKMSTEDTLYQQSMEARIDGLKTRVEDLRGENSKLKKRASKNEKDTHEFVSYFQNQLESKDQLIAKLSEQLTKKEVEFEKLQRKTKEECSTQVREAQFELQETKHKLESRVRVLEDELAVVTEYKHKRDALNNKLLDAEKKIEEQATDHKRQLAELERQFIEKSAKLQRDMDNRIESIKIEAREDAQKGLDQDTKKIISDNKRMSEELKFQLSTTDELQQVGKALGEENKRLKRNLALASEKEQEYAKTNYFKESELNNARQKIRQLEKTLAQTLQDFEEEQNKVVLENNKKVEELDLELAGLKQLVKLKNKELKNIRQLSQVILDQRTEVEQYFLEALEQVKSEIRKQREESNKKDEQEYRTQLRLAHKGKVKFPTIRGSQQPAQQSGGNSLFGNRIPVQPGIKIELRDLSWEDRERVLRMLFAKINAVENQTTDILKDTSFAPQITRHEPSEVVPYRPPPTEE